jgi:hypothetical protein
MDPLLFKHIEKKIGHRAQDARGHNIHHNVIFVAFLVFFCHFWFISLLFLESPAPKLAG